MKLTTPQKHKNINFIFFGKNEEEAYTNAPSYIPNNQEITPKQYEYGPDDARLRRILINFNPRDNRNFEDGSYDIECIDMEDGKYEYAIKISKDITRENSQYMKLAAEVNYEEIGRNGGGNDGNGGNVGFIVKTDENSTINFENFNSHSYMLSNGGASGGGHGQYAGYYIHNDPTNKIDNHGGIGQDVGSLIAESNGNVNITNCQNNEMIASNGGIACDISDVNNVFKSTGVKGGNAGGFIGSANGNLEKTVTFKGNCVNNGNIYSVSGANFGNIGQSRFVNGLTGSTGSTGTGGDGGNAGGFVGMATSHLIFSQSCKNNGIVLADGDFGGSTGSGLNNSTGTGRLNSTGTGAANGGNAGNAGGLVGLILGKAEIDKDADIKITNIIGANGGNSYMQAGPWYYKFGDDVKQSYGTAISGQGGNGGNAGALVGSTGNDGVVYNNSINVDVESCMVSSLAGKGCPAIPQTSDNDKTGNISLMTTLNNNKRLAVTNLGFNGSYNGQNLNENTDP